MLKKIWVIFTRDLKVNLRDSLPLFIIIAPLLLAVGINLISPSVNDTTVNLALIEGENSEQAAYFNDVAHVELFDDIDGVRERVERRDNVVGLLPDGDGYYVLAQGNEPDSVVEYARLLNVLYESDAQIENSRSELVDFGKTVPPLKKILVNCLLLMIPMMAGMIIALNIVEEKSDNTISAVGLSPVSRSGFILGKSLIGIAVAVITSVACILITGFGTINIGQMALVILASTALSLMIGFVQGVSSDDVMEAAGNVKLMFMPMAASVIGYELVSGSWQIFFYWSPFYWAYRANDAILSKSGTWPQLILYVGIIIVICGIAYALLVPKIKKGMIKNQ